MPDAYTLSEADRQTFKEMVADWRARQGNVERSGPPQDTHDREEFTAPPFYIARTGEFPIPAMSVNNVPGGAFCSIFSLLDGDLVGIDGGEKLVYNIGATEVAKNSWCHVQREPSGAWFATSPAGGVNSNSGGGTSTCGPGIGWTAGLRPTSCLDMRVISQSGDCGVLEELNIQHTLFYDSIQQWWALDPDLGLTFSIAGRQWTAKFQRATNGGLPTLVLIDAATVDSIGSFFGVLDCSGVDEDGNPYAIYAFGDPLMCDGGGSGSGSGSGAGTTQCDNVVRIKITCKCPFVTIECCEDVETFDLPPFVWVTFGSGGSGIWTPISGKSIRLPVVSLNSAQAQYRVPATGCVYLAAVGLGVESYGYVLFTVTCVANTLFWELTVQLSTDDGCAGDSVRIVSDNTFGVCPDIPPIERPLLIAQSAIQVLTLVPFTSSDIPITISETPP